ncbi:MAG: choice-of-anchor L domain-containing protein [Oscillibacter sp.]|nr:choice-of-anchor L domain-containing protein [Oscillibacter sp.]
MDLRTDRSLVMIGNDNTVYFYLQSSMPAPSDGKFNLCEVTDDGVEVVAELYDDGLYSSHGDDMAGDGVYSAKLSETPSEDSVKSFVASYGEVQSNRVEVKYYTPISEGTLTTMETVDNEINALISSPDFEQKTDAEKLSAVEAMINGFAESNLIVSDSAYYDETAGIYVFEYAEGILGGITIHKFDPVFNGITESVVDGSGVFNEKHDEVIGDSISLSAANDGGNSNADDSGNTDADDTGSTGSDDSGNTDTADAGNTNADDSGNSDGNDSGNSNADDSGNTDTDDTGSTASDDSGNTDTDDTGSTASDDSGNTGVNDGDNSNADDSGNTDANDDGNTGSNDGGNSNADDSGNTENISGQTGKALILNAFPSFETEATQIAYRTTFYQILRNTWNQKGLDTTLDTSVTVDDFKHFNEYDVVVIATHGSTYVWHDFLWFGKHQSPAICLSERSTKDKDKAYQAELKDKQVVKINGEYNLLSTFFENAYDANELSGKFIFSECCQFMGKGGSWDYSMANGIISRGASAIVGFHNSVFADYSREFMSNYVGGLLDGKTSQASYDGAISKMGANHAVWFQKTYSRTLQDWWEDSTAHGTPCPAEYGPGKYDAAYNIAYPHLGGENTSKLVNTGLKNGDFESHHVTAGNAVPTNWTIVGDVRSLDRLGEVKPYGSTSTRMVILTTGVGAKTTATVGEGTEGSSISQRLVIPQTATTLKFDYNFISEEPMEYVGSRFDDSFGIRLLRSNNVAFEETYESINTSEWHEVSDIDFDGGDNTAYQTGWKSVEVDVSSYRGQTISISFIIYDVGDSYYDSACVIDNVVLT